jgi:4-hydroxy-tetrahydrodipicolinate synthase
MAADTLRLRGILPALVTPMGADGSVDFDAFGRHVEWMLEDGVHGLVPCGTTGESATLDPAEQAEVIRRTVEVARGRVPVVAGAGGNSTRTVCALARAAADAGADALLVVTPPYNKPSPDGLVLHYRAIADAAGLPIVLYNVPGRTGLNVPPEVVLRVAAEVPDVVAVKESAGRVDQLMTLLAERPTGFQVLSGDDDLALPSLAAGADGVVSVAANEVPGPLVRLFSLTESGDLATARTLFYRLLPLLRANFVESNPVPLKTALELMGRGPAHLRAPLAPLRPESRVQLEAALRAAGVLA